MAMTLKPTVAEVEFEYTDNLLGFIRPLIVEGYSVAVRTVFRPFPRENSIEKYIVSVLVDKDKEMKVTVVDPKGDEE